MTPIERTILKCLKFLITESNNKHRETNDEERIDLMNEIDTLEFDKRREEPCCEMPERDYALSGGDEE